MNAHPRVAARRLAVAEDLARRAVQRLLKVGIAVAILAAAVGVAYSPLASVRKVVVVGAVRADVAGALSAGQIQAGTPLIRVKTEEAERWLASDPWVISATVARKFPSRVEVSIRERHAVADIQTPQGWATVSNDGRVMSLGVGPAPSLGRVLAWNQPLAVGSHVPEKLAGAVELLATLPPQQAEQLELAFEGEELVGGWGGARIRFGSSQEIQAKASSLGALAAAGVLVPGASVDLLAPQRPAVSSQVQVDS